MIYDTFNFFNELELLEIRLHELNDFVDVFVLVEGTKTFQNKPKPLYYEENKHLFAAFHHKIRHIVIDDSPDTDEQWAIERFQFNQSGRGMPEIGVDDYILWCCVDEIPNKEAIRSAMRYATNPQMMMMKNFSGYLNCLMPAPWTGGRLLTGRMWRESKSPYDDFRLHWLGNHIDDAGWHFCNMGGADRLRLKWQSFGHKELNTPEHMATCDGIVQSCYELKPPMALASLDTLPPYVAAHKEKFAHMLIPDQK